MNESGKTATHGTLEATFRCGACNEVAAVVTSVPRGGTYPGPILEVISHQADWLVIDGFLGTQGKAVESHATAVRDALQHSSARQLYDIAFLWAPFYCSECHESYCWNCWESWIVMDEEDPGWYDCT